jgi:hypothetical protein
MAGRVRDERTEEEKVENARKRPLVDGTVAAATDGVLDYDLAVCEGGRKRGRSEQLDAKFETKREGNDDLLT